MGDMVCVHPKSKSGKKGDDPRMNKTNFRVEDGAQENWVLGPVQV